MATRDFMRRAVGWTTSGRASRVGRVKAAIINYWLGLTGELRSSLPAYQAAMDVRDEGNRLVLVVRGEPKLARMVEDGEGPFSLNETLLREGTRSIRRSKAGHLFLRVPFGVTTRMIRAWGGSKLEQMARNLTQGGRLPAGLIGKASNYHATDMAAGVTRIAPVGGGGPTNAYMKWRTISERGKMWVHPGIKARHFLRRVAEAAPDIARAILRGE